MAKILVIHGAGMNMRGRVQVEIFGPLTLPEYDERIRAYAAAEDLGVDIFHSNIEGEVINRLYEADAQGLQGALINPAGFRVGYPALNLAISQVRFPTIEIHLSNPAQRGMVSDIARACRGTISGLGLTGYQLGLRALKAMHVTH